MYKCTFQERNCLAKKKGFFFELIKLFLSFSLFYVKSTKITDDLLQLYCLCVSLTLLFQFSNSGKLENGAHNAIE